MHTHCKQKTAAKSHKTPGKCFVFTYRFFKVLVFKKIQKKQQHTNCRKNTYIANKPRTNCIQISVALCKTNTQPNRREICEIALQRCGFHMFAALYGNKRNNVLMSLLSCPQAKPKLTSTSSTAQGGGGSFKNETYRRGWWLWIRDGRAKPLMDRKVLEVTSLSLSFSDYLSMYLCIYVPIYLSIDLSIYPSIDLLLL